MTMDHPERRDSCPLEPSDVDKLSPYELGRFGEALAATYLVHAGCQVLDRNFRCAAGEADLVVYDQITDEVVLVEVKSRRVRATDPDLFPEEAVDEEKLRRYRRILSCYVRENYPVPHVRFDVIALSFHRGRQVDVDHLKDVFSWGEVW